MKKISCLTILALVAGVTPLLAQEEHGSSGPLVVNGGLMIWTLVVFGLLFLVLRKYAWPVILEAVEAREAALERQLAEAEKNRAESAALLAEHQKLVAKAKSDAQGILAEAATASEKMRQAALEKTRHEQDELLARARRDITAERDKALADLRREAVDLSLAAAGKLISQRLDGAADRALVEGFLASLEKAK